MCKTDYDKNLIYSGDLDQLSPGGNEVNVISCSVEFPYCINCKTGGTLVNGTQIVWGTCVIVVITLILQEKEVNGVIKMVCKRNCHIAG